jgi:hypothetical protein
VTGHVARRVAACAAALALVVVLGGCGGGEPAFPPASERDTRAVRAAVEDLLGALAAGSPERFCAALTRASQVGDDLAYVAANRRELLATEVERKDVREIVANLRIAVNGDRALAVAGDNEFPLQREGNGWKVDLTAVEP